MCRKKNIVCFLFILGFLISGVSPAHALGIIGKVIVKIDGFQGWTMVRDVDLEIRVNDFPAYSNKGGAFRIDDIGVFGHNLQQGSTVSFSNEQQNYVRVLVGKNRIVLPITWRGRVEYDYLVLEPVQCEVLADGRGACVASDYDPASHGNKLRMMLGLNTIEGAVVPSAPHVIAPAPTQGGVVVPSGPTVVAPPPAAVVAPPPVVQPVQPSQPTVAQPATPALAPIQAIEPMGSAAKPAAKPAPKPADPTINIDVVEPME